MYHGQQAHAWLRNVVNGVGSLLVNAGLHAASERQPAICFLDITGYTRLTQERGDTAAAELAENLSRDRPAELNEPRRQARQVAGRWGDVLLR